ncbi:hypothetical protein [Geminisphaera colitermitum]|uniref:hypothetical protein n=1 Tax=Geminisphaera colitermitum TaxID=1148786 RepID=UPI000158D052|nr:hypothetical protein [Geminisphaera colitermitum]
MKTIQKTSGIFNRVSLKMLFACSAALLLTFVFSPHAHAATIVPGQSIDFTSDDFSSGLTSSKQWAIYGNGATAQDTLVWESAGLRLSTSFLDSSNATSASMRVSWKVTVPEDYTITAFTFGIGRLALTGAAAGDDHVEVQYSFDNVNWTTFDDGIFYHQSAQNDLTFTASVDTGTSVTSLFLRVFHVEGTTVTGDSGYFAVRSNPTGTGLYANSFIQLTVVPIPESSTIVFVLAAGSLGLGLQLARRYRHRKG